MLTYCHIVSPFFEPNLLLLTHRKPMFGQKLEELYTKPRTNLGIPRVKHLRSASQNSPFNFPMDSFRKKSSISQLYRTELRHKRPKDSNNELNSKAETNQYIIRTVQMRKPHYEPSSQNRDSALNKEILNFSNGLLRKEMPREQEKAYFKRFLRSDVDVRKFKYEATDRNEPYELLHKKLTDFIDEKRNFENTGWMMNAIDLHEMIRNKIDRNDVRKPDFSRFYKQYYRQRGNQNVSFKLILN